MTLTKQNYFEYGVDVENPVMNSSMIKHILDSDGGSPEMLKYQLENYDAIRAEEKYRFGLESGKLLHSYLENQDNFAIANFTRPEGLIPEIITRIFTHALEVKSGVYEHVGVLADWENAVVDVVRDIGWQPKWGDDAIKRNILKDGERYFRFLVEKGDAHVLTDKEHEVLSGQMNKWHTSHLYSTDEQTQWQKEVPIEWEQKTMWGTVKCKSLLDKLHIDYDSSRAIIEDIKTTRDPAQHFISKQVTRMSFINGDPNPQFMAGPFVNYRMYRQMAFYRRALRHNLSKDGFPSNEFTISCRFLVFENSPPFQIKMFEAPESWLNAGDVEIDAAFAGLMHYHQEYGEGF